MGDMTGLTAALIFGAASNLDTLILALAWGARGRILRPGQWAVIGGVTTGVTWCALALGALAGRLARAAALLGPVVLMALGLWTLLDWLRRLDRPEEAPPPPEGLRGCLPLAGTLAVNNGGIGAAAGAAGLPPLEASAVNLALTLAALALGAALGRKLRGRLWGQLALPLSGVLLVVLGALGSRM